MDGITCRLLPYAVADGPHNMAADETLLHSAIEGTASLRFYGWSPPTLSLGYFQHESVRRADPLLAELPFVRRPSGGHTLVHHHEVTYALALPPGQPWQILSVPWLRRMHEIVAVTLNALGVRAKLFNPLAKSSVTSVLCFHRFTESDLLFENFKIVGSAQRKRRGALLQHGSILLARSPFSPTLLGIREAAGIDIGSQTLVEGVIREFSRDTGWLPFPSEWTGSERASIESLASSRYDHPSWNERR